MACKRLLESVRPVPDHHRRRRRLQLTGGRKHVLDERETGGSMENLRPGGFHPRALTGRQNDDVKTLHLYDRRSTSAREPLRRASVDPP
jgi:hypothetical protein